MIAIQFLQRTNTMNRPSLGGRLMTLLVLFGVTAGAMLSLSGCAAFGVIAQTLPPPQVLPQYHTGLLGQSVAVMVWVDRGIKIDWPDLSLDTAAGLENKLKAGQKDLPKYLLGTTFPTPAVGIVRLQEDHPEWDGVPITDIATQLHVTRLIYVEVDAFQTRVDSSPDLYKGTILGSLKVIEIAPDGKAKIGYSEDGIRASYPPDSPEDGVLNAGDDKIYTGTLDAFTTELVHRFLPYEQEKKD
jgi:hypothetical protein